MAPGFSYSNTTPDVRYWNVMTTSTVGTKIDEQEQTMQVAGIIEDKYENTMNLCIEIEQVSSSGSRQFKWEIKEDDNRSEHGYRQRLDYGYSPTYDMAVFTGTKKVRKLLKAQQPHKPFSLFRGL